MNNITKSFAALGIFAAVAAVVLGLAAGVRQLQETRRACVDLSQRVVVQLTPTPVVSASPSATPVVTTTLKKSSSINFVAPSVATGK